MGSYSNLKKELEQNCPELQLLEDEPMSRHTTFKVGGPVPLMAVPRSVDEACFAVSEAARQGFKPFFLGNGSNLLVSDSGADMFVIKTVGGLSEIEFTGNTVTAESGTLLNRLSAFAQELGLTGLEFAGGIPGSVGGAMCMNAGAYGGEMAQVVTAVTVLNHSGEISVVQDPHFSYRHSDFSDGDRLVLSAQFSLEPADPEAIATRMQELMDKRRKKQPLDIPSAGSTFKRPKEGYAAELIDRCGLKGLSVGGAQVSEKHAGFIVNRGGATCRDILDLMALVREKVMDETGIELEPEVKLLGEEFPWNC